MKYRYLAAAGTIAISIASIGMADAATVYIPEGSAGTVLVVDSKTGRITGRLTDLPDIHGLGGTGGARYLVAGSFAELPAEAAMAVKRPPSVSEDDHAAHHGGGARQPAPDMVSILTVIAAADGSVVRRLEVPGAVHHVAVSPDGRFALATHPNAEGVSVVDLDALEVVGLVRTGPMPNYVVFDPESARAYVSNAGNGTVSEIDVARRIVRRNLDAGQSPEHIVITPDGKTLYVANVDAGKVTAIDVDAGTIAKTFGIGGELHGLDLSDDGSLLFVSGKGEDKLAAIDLASGDIRTERLAPAPYHLTAIRGSGKLYVSSREEPRVWIVDQSSLKATGSIEIEGEGHQMVVMP